MKISYLLLISIFALFLSACQTAQTSGAKINTADIAKITIDKTTQSQIQSMFGRPSNIMPIGNKETMWVYSTNYAKRNSLAFFAPIIGRHATIDTTSQSISNNFNENKIVSNCIITLSEFKGTEALSGNSGTGEALPCSEYGTNDVKGISNNK